MSSIRSGELGSPTNSFHARAKARRVGRPAIWTRLVVGVVAVLSLGVFASGASADGSVTLPGGPLQVSVGSLGECQSSYANVGTNYFPPEGTVGDCGFFLAFPSASANPTPLQGGGQGTVFGFQGSAGPHVPSDGKGGQEYTAIEQGPVTGSGTSASPYTEVTTYKVSYESKDYALITATTTYVNGEAQFTSSYAVENVTGQSISGLNAAQKPPSTSMQSRPAICLSPTTTMGPACSSAVRLGSSVDRTPRSAPSAVSSKRPLPGATGKRVGGMKDLPPMNR